MATTCGYAQNVDIPFLVKNVKYVVRNMATIIWKCDNCGTEVESEPANRPVVCPKCKKPSYFLGFQDFVE